MPKTVARKPKTAPPRATGAPHLKLPQLQTNSPQMNFAKLIQESMGSLEEDAKLSIIENLMPKDFVQGPN